MCFLWSNAELELGVCLKKEPEPDCNVPLDMIKPVAEDGEKEGALWNPPAAPPAPYPSRLTLAFPPQSFSSSNWAVQSFLPKAVHQHAVGPGEGSDPAPSGWVSGCHSASDAYTNRTPPDCSSAFHPLEAYGCLVLHGMGGQSHSHWQMGKLSWAGQGV